MVVSDAIHNIMGGLENSGDVRLHNHRRKLKQRFDIVRKLGQGTYGKVQLGINKETGQEVAIKTIRKCKIETEADLIRIRREIQIMSSVRHPNIIHIYEVFENRDKMVLVMECAAGGELYDYLSERKVLSETEARRIFRQIATAVYYCHKHNICHRDLKLENILLDENGNAKIADFGLSNVFCYSNLLSTFCGSPLYASPEIVKGTPYHGPEVDCWSLGVLLYTLVYGAMPFDGSNFKRLVRQISQGDYFEPKNPSPASELISEMLNVNPARRADISAICSHWWINETYKEQCLDVAQELASQTPVRLDLLLSLNQAVNNEKLVAPNDQIAGNEDMNGNCGRPVRSHSLGSISPQQNNISTYTIPEMKEPEERKPKVKRKDRSHSRSRKNDRSTSRQRKVTEDSKHEKKTDDSDENLNRTFTKMPSVETVANNTFTKLPTSKTDENATNVVEVKDKKVSNEVKVPDSDKADKSSEKIRKPKTTVNKKSEPEKVPETASPRNIEKIPNKMERRNSKVFEIAEKFNGTQDKVIKTPSKKIMTPGVDVSKVKKDIEKQSSMASEKSAISDVSAQKPILGTAVISKSSKNEELPVDFPLASTVALNKLVESVLGDEPLEPSVPFEEPKKPVLNTQRSREEEKKVKNAVKVISNAITEGGNKASTLPRRKTSRAEIQLVTPTCTPDNYRTEVEHYVNKPTINHKTEVVFPVSAPLPPRALSKQGNQSKEHIIPIQIESEPVSKVSNPPISQSRSTIARTSSSSLSRQSTIESDSGSNISSIAGEPIRKSHREVIIPIAVEGGGYVTPSNDALTRMSSVTETEDEGHGSRCFTLRSTKRKQPSGHQIAHTDTADSLSSEEEDDNFQLLTAENLFSTLLSRVRSLTQRLNDGEVRRNTAFPQSFFTHHSSFFDDPPSRRLTETRSFSRPESAPWRRNFSTNSTPPRRDFQLASNTKPDTSNHEMLTEPNIDNDMEKSCKYIRSHSISTCRDKNDATKLPNNISVTDNNVNSANKNGIYGSNVSINREDDIDNTDNDNGTPTNDSHDDDNCDLSNTSTARTVSKLNVDKEFKDFFAKYKKPASILDNKDYFSDFEERLTSQLRPSYRYITRKNNETSPKLEDLNTLPVVPRSMSYDRDISKSNDKKETAFDDNKSKSRSSKCLSMCDETLKGLSSELDILNKINNWTRDKIQSESNDYEKKFISKLNGRLDISLTSPDNVHLQGKPPAKRISRFLRPDFYDTPREESKYVTNIGVRQSRERSLSRQRSYTVSNEISRNSSNSSISENSYRRSSSNNAVPNVTRFSLGRDLEKPKYDPDRISKILDRKTSLDREYGSKSPNNVSTYDRRFTAPISSINRIQDSTLYKKINNTFDEKPKDSLSTTSLSRNRLRTFDKEKYIRSRSYTAQSDDESFRRHSLVNPSKLKYNILNNQGNLEQKDDKKYQPQDIISKEPSITAAVKSDASELSSEALINKINNLKSRFGIKKTEVNTKSDNNSKTGDKIKGSNSSNILIKKKQFVDKNESVDPSLEQKKYLYFKKLSNLNSAVEKENGFTSDNKQNTDDNQDINSNARLKCKKTETPLVSSPDRSVTDSTDIHSKDEVTTSEYKNNCVKCQDSPLSSKCDDSNSSRCGDSITSSTHDDTNTTSIHEEINPSRTDENGSEESVIDRIRRRSYYSRFNLSRQRSSNDTTQRRLPTYSRSLSADYRYRSPSLHRPF